MFEEDDSGSTGILDMIASILLVFIVMLYILLPHINDPSKKEETKQDAMLVYVEWQKTIDADIDLWVQSPNDVPVGYSNKGGKNFNLLRDDLGFTGDVSPPSSPFQENREESKARQVTDGEWRINLHLYRETQTPKPPYRVLVWVYIKPNQAQASAYLALTKEVWLTKENQELTVFRFTTKDGRLVKDSVFDAPVKLRSGPAVNSTYQGGANAIPH